MTGLVVDVADSSLTLVDLEVVVDLSELALKLSDQPILVLQLKLLLCKLFFQLLVLLCHFRLIAKACLD